MTSTSTKHIVLLGDSIIDNRVYVKRGDPSVINQLEVEAKQRSWKASSLAVDGHCICNIAQQLEKLPQGATHIFISIGGNNVLRYMEKTGEKVQNVQQALVLLRQLQDDFAKQYVEMIESVKKLSIPTTVCTIYNPNFTGVEQQKLSETGLAAFNDVILREAIRNGIPVIDLRTIFNDPKDYANQIEPDVQGGAKIVRNIIEVVDNHPFDKHICSVYCRQ